MRVQGISKESKARSVSEIEEERGFLGTTMTTPEKGLFVKTHNCLIRLGPGDISYWYDRMWESFVIDDFEYVDCEIQVTERGEEE